MLEKLLDSIEDKILPISWEIYGFSIGDNFDLITNENPLYENNEYTKGYAGALFYKSKSSNNIEGIFLSIPFFENRQKEILDKVKDSYGDPYFDHMKMNDRTLYYPQIDLYVSIQRDDVTKGICLSIGKCGTYLQKFRANDIIDTYVKLINQDSAIFKEEENGNVSRSTSLKIKTLKSLLLAFLGNPDIHWFESGKFILESNEHFFNKILNNLNGIEIYKSLKDFETTIINQPSRLELYGFWKMLFNYYLNNIRYIKNTQAFNHINWKKNDLEELKITFPKDKVNDKMSSLKRILSKMINSDQKVIDLKVMTLNFGYPKEDISWIEANEY